MVVVLVLVVVVVVVVLVLVLVVVVVVVVVVVSCTERSSEEWCADRVAYLQKRGRSNHRRYATRPASRMASER